MAGTPGRLAEPLQVVPRGPADERQSERHGERGVAQQGAADRLAEAPLGMAGDDFQDLRTGRSAGSGLNHVRLGRETVVERATPRPGRPNRSAARPEFRGRPFSRDRPSRPGPAPADGEGCPDRPPSGSRDGRAHRPTGEPDPARRASRPGQAPPSGESGDRRPARAGRRGSAGRCDRRGSPRSGLRVRSLRRQELQDLCLAAHASSLGRVGETPRLRSPTGGGELAGADLRRRPRAGPRPFPPPRPARSRRRRRRPAAPPGPRRPGSRCRSRRRSEAPRRPASPGGRSRPDSPGAARAPRSCPFARPRRGTRSRAERPPPCGTASKSARRGRRCRATPPEIPAGSSSPPPAEGP